MELKKMNFKNVTPKIDFIRWLAIVILSALPYIHDLITIRNVGPKSWVPDLGIEALLTDPDGRVLGFSSYRIFLYTFLLHLFAHIGWTGWFFDAKGKTYRTALLIPVALSLYQLTIILTDTRSTHLNAPDTKLYITFILGILLAINYFFNNKLRKA
jgi:hypothetical protein